jgi:hypothetical protein
MLRWCGCGPSDCQKSAVVAEISLVPGGGGGGEVLASAAVWSGLVQRLGCKDGLEVESEYPTDRRPPPPPAGDPPRLGTPRWAWRPCPRSPRPRRTCRRRTTGDPPGGRQAWSVLQRSRRISMACAGFEASFAGRMGEDLALELFLGAASNLSFVYQQTMTQRQKMNDDVFSDNSTTSRRDLSSRERLVSWRPVSPLPTCFIRDSDLGDAEFSAAHVLDPAPSILSIQIHD